MSSLYVKAVKSLLQVIHSEIRHLDIEKSKQNKKLNLEDKHSVADGIKETL